MKAILICLLIGCATYSEGGMSIWKPGHRFQKAPITLENHLPSLYGETVQEAVTTVNNQIGCEVFLLASKGAQDGSGAILELTGEAFSYTVSNVAYIAPGDVGQLYLDVQHELGHVLGLAHWPYGIMRQGIDHAHYMEHRRLLPTFTSEQRRNLKTRYCR